MQYYSRCQYIQSPLPLPNREREPAAVKTCVKSYDALSHKHTHLARPRKLQHLLKGQEAIVPAHHVALKEAEVGVRGDHDRENVVRTGRGGRISRGEQQAPSRTQNQA